MPPIETFERNEKAVYWKFLRRDRTGQPVFDIPRELNVRWQQQTILTTDRFGQEIVFNAQAVVGEDLVKESLLWLGTLSEWYGVGSAGNDTNLMQIADAWSVPDLKGRISRRTLGLKLYKSKVTQG